MVMEAERLFVERFGLREVDVGRPVGLVCEGHDVDRDGDCRSGEIFLAARAAPLLVLRVVVRVVLEGRVVTAVVSGANSSSGGRGPTGSSAAEKQKVQHYVAETIAFVQAEKHKTLEVNICLW